MKKAEHYVKIFCDCVYESHLNAEIAHEGPHVLGKLMDHLGEMPNSSGFFHDVLSSKVEKMRSLHPDFNLAVVLLAQLTDDQYDVICAWEIMINKRPEFANKHLRSGKEVLEYLVKHCRLFKDRNYDWFQKTRKRGLERMNASMGIF